MAGLCGIVALVYSGATIENCTSNVNITADINSNPGTYYYVGGIAGYVSDGVIKKCAYYGSMQLNSRFVFGAGGIVGYCTGTLSIDNCAFYGSIDLGARSSYVGGIIGFVSSRYVIGITNCLSAGNFAWSGNNNQYIGAIAGYFTDYVAKETIKNNCCLNTVSAIGYDLSTGTYSENALNAMSSEEIASGKAAYLLQSGQTDGTLVWGQKSTSSGSAPVLTSDETFRVKPVKNSSEEIVGYSLYRSGDLNGDGVVNRDDYNSLKSEMFENAFTADKLISADFNGDGVIDGFDLFTLDKILNGYYSPVFYEKGDLNGDGKIDNNDYALLDEFIKGSLYGTKSDEFMKAADVNHDGVIDGFDLFSLDKMQNGY